VTSLFGDDDDDDTDALFTSTPKQVKKSPQTATRSALFGDDDDPFSSMPYVCHTLTLHCRCTTTAVDSTYKTNHSQQFFQTSICQFV